MLTETFDEKAGLIHAEGARDGIAPFKNEASADPIFPPVQPTQTKPIA